MGKPNVVILKCPGDGLAKIDPNDLLNRSLFGVDSREFMRPWLAKADEARINKEWFEALIYLWVTFNAWLGRIVTDRDKSDRDNYLVQAAGLDPHLTARFTRLLHEDEEFSKLVQEFYSLWPIFKVRTLAEKDIEPWGAWNTAEDRSQFRDKCFSRGLGHRDYAPSCYKEHQLDHSGRPGGDPNCVPLDWRHVSIAIYQVRCNLFHGGKSFYNSKDKDFTRLAIEILWKVWGSEQLDKHPV